MPRREEGRAEEPLAEGKQDPLLPPLETAPGVESAVLVDRAGRLVENRGLDDPSRLRQVASLVAAMHATGARLSEASGDPGRAWITVGAGDRTLLLVPLPRPGTLILLLVLTGDERRHARAFVERLVERIREELPPPAVSVDDPRDFEATLERSLEAAKQQSLSETNRSDARPLESGG
ncbi:MAG: hypothetical protein EA421_15505 [Gemmatimonadales bacterium]|nr:MAG: hypothetical protein EA421_15505 [Gemmatimonadales bacterium]